jgi:hypothetical protein
MLEPGGAAEPGMKNLHGGDARIVSYEEISPLDIPEWDDLIGGYATKSLFHESSWLRFVEKSQGAKIRGLKLLDEQGAAVGYLTAAEVRKGFFRLLGSPLQGWTTNFMGPVVNHFDTEGFLQVLDRYCRARRVDYLELCSPVLPAPAMRRAAYELDPDSSFIVKIDDEASMWRRLQDKSCRYCIRRARRNGLRIERTTDPAVVHEYWARFENTFLRQGLRDVHGIGRTQALWDCLMPAGRLLALRVWHGDEVLAAGLFPYDERAIYLWGAASWVRAYSLYPNEFMQWNVLLFALEQGIPEYHMGSGAHYKKKFGGALVPFERWFKPFSALARVGRTALRHYIRAKQRVLGRLKLTLRSGVTEVGAAD